MATPKVHNRECRSTRATLTTSPIERVIDCLYFWASFLLPPMWSMATLKNKCAHRKETRTVRRRAQFSSGKPNIEKYLKIPFGLSITANRTTWQRELIYRTYEKLTSVSRDLADYGWKVVRKTGVKLPIQAMSYADSSCAVMAQPTCGDITFGDITLSDLWFSETARIVQPTTLTSHENDRVTESHLQRIRSQIGTDLLLDNTSNEFKDATKSRRRVLVLNLT